MAHTTANPEVLRHQLMTANTRLAHLEAQLAASRATTGIRAPELLIDVAAALHHASDATTPTISVPTDETTSSGKPASRPPSRPDPGAARARRSLETTIGRAVAAYWSKAATDFDHGAHHPPTDKPPTVRCRNRTCPRHDRRTPTHIRLGDSTIQLTYCPACATRLT
jgi:hypothetical protein